MMAGVRNLKSGECTLLATGVIAAHEGGQAAEAAQIGADTTRVIFKLTALTAEIKDAKDSAFTLDPANYGKTKIDGKEHPFFAIKTPAVAGDAETTNAELTLAGWGGKPEENDTQQFIHLVHNPGDVLHLAGIGTNTDDGDGPLPSTADVTWRISNAAGAMSGGNEKIQVTFTSKSTAAYSGMGWLPVRAPVQAFGAGGTQVWQAGSGILGSQLDGGAGTEGGGIVILHGNKMSQPGVGAGQDWTWEYVLDLANAAPKDVAGMWDYTPPNTITHAPGVYRLTGGKAKTLVRVINSTTTHSIVVADNAEVTVLLDGMDISLPDNTNAILISPFSMGINSITTLYLADGTDNTLQSAATSPAYGAGLQTTAGAALTIKGNTGKLTATGGNLGAGIGSCDFPGGNITIEGGVITATGGLHSAGIGGGNGNDGGDITINGGTVYAKGSELNYYGGGAGIGGGGSQGSAAGGSGTIRITGGLVIAESPNGAGIGGGGCGGAGGPGQGITISGGTVIAKGGVPNGASYYGSAGIGGGGTCSSGPPGGNSGDITISGDAVVIAVGGDGVNDGAGIGSGSGNSGSGSVGTITLNGGTIYAKGHGTALGIGKGNGTTGGTFNIGTNPRPLVFASSTLASSNFDHNPANGIIAGGTVTLGTLAITPTSFTFTMPVEVTESSASLTVPALSTFTIPSGMTFTHTGTGGGATLTNSSLIVNKGTLAISTGNTLLNNGTITMTSSSTLDDQSGSTVINNGTVNKNGGAIANGGSWTVPGIINP
jgi:hypothetical protein